MPNLPVNAFLKPAADPLIDYSALRALVVDDYPGMRNALRLTLSNFGVTKVQVASNAAEALFQIRNRSYDMYMDMGFDDIGVYTEVHSRRTDGRVSTDRRLFMSKLLSRRKSALTTDDGTPERFGTST